MWTTYTYIYSLLIAMSQVNENDDPETYEWYNDILYMFERNNPTLVKAAWSTFEQNYEFVSK